MALKEISSADHALLLYRIDFLPDDERQEIREVFINAYGDYLDRVYKLQQTCKAYEALSNCIRSRVPLSERDRQAECIIKDIADYREKKLLVSSLNNS
jgi:hypothetical protein